MPVTANETETTNEMPAAAAHGLRQAGRPARLARALAGQLPEPRQPSRLTKDTPAGDVVLAYLRDQAAALTSLDPAVRRDEPDAVHQMRVATRRLRGTLRSFRRVTGEAGHLAGELKWLGGVLGEARDAEVLAGHLQAMLATVPAEQLIGPVQARVRVHFAPVAAQAREAVLAALESQRYFSLLDELDALLAEPPLRPRAARPAGQVLPPEVRRSYRKTARRMDRARRSEAGPPRDVALHEARKAAKQARYAAEVAAPVIGRPARKFARRMKKVQSVLGEHQDAVIARQAERALSVQAHLAGENAFTYGLLYEREAQAGQALQARARRVWRKASRARKWLG